MSTSTRPDEDLSFLDDDLPDEEEDILAPVGGGASLDRIFRFEMLGDGADRVLNVYWGGVQALHIWIAMAVFGLAAIIFLFGLGGASWEDRGVWTLVGIVTALPLAGFPLFGDKRRLEVGCGWLRRRSTLYGLFRNLDIPLNEVEQLHVQPFQIMGAGTEALFGLSARLHNGKDVRLITFQTNRNARAMEQRLESFLGIRDAKIRMLPPKHMRVFRGEKEVGIRALPTTGTLVMWMVFILMFFGLSMLFFFLEEYDLLGFLLPLWLWPALRLVLLYRNPEEVRMHPDAIYVKGFGAPSPFAGGSSVRSGLSELGWYLFGIAAKRKVPVEEGMWIEYYQWETYIEHPDAMVDDKYIQFEIVLRHPEMKEPVFIASSRRLETVRFIVQEMSDFYRMEAVFDESEKVYRI